MQKHRKVAYAVGESPLKRLCYAKNERQKKKRKKRILPNRLQGERGSVNNHKIAYFTSIIASLKHILPTKTEHNWMQKHRKVAYAGAESPLERLCYAKKKAGKKKQNGYCPTDTHVYLANNIVPARAEGVFVSVRRVPRRLNSKAR